VTPAELILTSVGLLLLGCTSRPPLPPQAVAQNDQGIEALATGDLETAGARFRLALEYNPRFVEALCNLGLVELELGNLKRARQLLMRASRVNEDIAQPHHGLGVLAEREGHVAEASRHYRAALAVDPGFMAARLNLARLLFNAGLLYEAKLEYEKLVQLEPRLPQAAAGLAETLLRLGRRAEAETMVVEALERFPDSVELGLLQARIDLKHARLEVAMLRLVQLTEARDEFSAEAFAWLAVAELARRRPRHAIGAAKRALELDGDSRVARHAMFVALEALEDPRSRDYQLSAPPVPLSKIPEPEPSSKPRVEPGRQRH